MDFQVLGPIVVQQGGQSVAPRRAQERTMLAMLLMNANRSVSTENIIEALWNGSNDRDYRHTVHVYASRLRSLLEASTSLPWLEGLSSGYLLHVDPGRIDLVRFEKGIDGGRIALDSGNAGEAVRKLRRALSLWRGQPFADGTDAIVLRTEARRLEELRLQAMIECIEAELQLGHHTSLVPRLSQLVSEHPYQERLRGQLMLALYRSGRQAEALDVYQQGSAILGNELGLEPGPWLQELEEEILLHDSSLEWSLST